MQYEADSRVDWIRAIVVFDGHLQSADSWTGQSTGWPKQRQYYMDLLRKT